MARPTKLTPEITKKFVDAIRVGATQRIAALYAGVTDDTIINWRTRHPEFAEAIREAEGAGAVQSLAKIEQAASAGDWRAAAWKMERRFPQEYGKTVQEVQGKDGTDLTIRVEYADSGSSETT